MNPWHTLGHVKRLEDKPLQTFEKTDKFLYIVRAEEEQLITSRIEVPPLSRESAAYLQVSPGTCQQDSASLISFGSAFLCGRKRLTAQCNARLLPF